MFFFIFSYACTDDGSTGRSLSLVSKYIHHTFAPYKLQSVSVSGADQAIRFALILQRTPLQQRNVHHLFVSKDITAQPISVKPNDQRSSYSPIVRATTNAVEVIPGVRWYKKHKPLKENVAHNVQCMQANRQRDESIFVVFLQILHLTAHTLRTLSVDFESRRLSTMRIRLMPMLVSLTIGYYALFHSEVDESLFLESADGGMALLPRLRHLDLVGFRIPSRSSDLFDRIARFLI